MSARKISITSINKIYDALDDSILDRQPTVVVGRHSDIQDPAQTFLTKKNKRGDRIDEQKSI
jgi:hypothetical protein